jgi:hypothetical protein
MNQTNDRTREICEQIYEQHRTGPLTTLELMKLAFVSGRLVGHRAGFDDGCMATSQNVARSMNAMDLVLNGGVQRPTEPPLTVRGVEWDEPTDDELEASEQRGARSYASQVDDPIIGDRRHIASRR